MCEVNIIAEKLARYVKHGKMLALLLLITSPQHGALKWLN